jgi:hypothetical protein
MFSHFQTHQLFLEKQHAELVIKAYALDQDAMMLITLNKKESRKHYNQRMMKIYDLKQGR